MKKLLFVLVFIGLLIVVALTAAAYWPSSSGTGSEKGYTFDEVTWGSLVEKINATGAVWPRDVANVFSEGAGKVDKVLVDFNDKVEKDQPLVKLKADDYQLALDKAKADLEAAKFDLKAAQDGFDHVQTLFKMNIVKKEEKFKAEHTRDAADSKVHAAEIGLKRAQQFLDRTIIKAPISGIILHRKVKEGQTVSPIPSPTMPAIGNPLSGNPFMGMTASTTKDFSAPGSLFTIVKDFKDMEVEAQILQSDISKIMKGQEALVTVEDSELIDDNDRVFKGKVADVRMMPASTQGATSYSAIIRVVNRPNPISKAKEPLNWTLWPGMTPTVDIIRRTHDNVWKMPNAALTLEVDPHFLTLAAKSKLARKPNDWAVVWIMDKNSKPWPIFVRTTPKDGKGETGINDGSYTEVLEWDAELDPKPIARNPSTYPRVIISTPQVPQSIFDRGTFKVS
jgi:HlyD family secretion protein